MMAISSDSHLVTKQLFMWLMASMYLFAFASLYTQIPGLYGPQGLTPIRNVLPKPQSHLTWFARLKAFPSLLIYYRELNLSPSLAMELSCALGVLCSFLMMIFRVLRCNFMFALLWIFYLSVYKVGQVFLWFQWDSLLLEAGFLTILLAPGLTISCWKKPVGSCHDGLTLWLIRWLLFRLMFASGIVKLTSLCPTWWGLTALNYHYETQCIPTPLSWYAHQFPEWVQKMSVVATFFIEIATPILFFLPVRSLRIFGFLSQVFLQVLIIATGNYNFFNLLTITLSISLIDDHFLGYGSNKKHSNFFHAICGKSISSALKILSFITVTGILLALTVYFFDIKLDFKNFAISSNTNFSEEGFEHALAVAVPVLAIMAAVSLAIELLNALLEVLQQPGILDKALSLLSSLFVCGIVVAMFSISLISHGVLDQKFHNSIPSSVKTVHDQIDQFSVTSHYGLFRRMTGVEGRPEVIIEGTNSEPPDTNSAQWKEYNFLYKPGHVNTPPVFVAPHQPRLDWQMWFAALGNYKNNPWLVHLAYKLLVGEKDVLQLMDVPPFSSPPKYIRAHLYHYHFTAYNISKPIFNQSQMWWERSLKNDFLYPLSKDNEKLKEYLHSYGYLTKVDTKTHTSPLLPLLFFLRDTSNKLSAPVLLWSLFFTALVSYLTLSLIFPERSERQSAVHGANIEQYLEAFDSGSDEESRAQENSKMKQKGLYKRHK